MKLSLFLLIAPFLLCQSLTVRAVENFKAEKLADGFWRIQAVQGTLSTVYLVEGSRSALVIDACTGQEGLKEIVDSLVGSKPVKLALTHGHFDHSGGMKYFPEVYVHKADTGMLPKGLKTIWHFIDEGYVFDLGDKKIEVISIPGHTPGSVAFFNREERKLFTGDAIGSTMVWAHISKDPLTVLLASLHKLEDMKGLIDEIYVGHHEQEKIKLTPQYITDMRIATEKVLSGTIQTSRYEMGARSGQQATYGSATLIFNPANLCMTDFIAHRGESGTAPENTLAAFRLAWELNADAAELDIQLSKDNRIVVIHDEDTKRTGGQQYVVKDTPSDLMRGLDVGSFKGEHFKGEKIPFLEEVLEIIPSGRELVIELKSGADVLPFLEKTVAASAVKKQLVFIGFDFDAIAAAKRMFPENRCYWLSSNRKETLEKLDAVAAAGLDGVDLHFIVIDKELMDKANALKLGVIAWTVDDPIQAKRLIDLGVSGITTNRSAWLRAQVLGLNVQ
jgi:glycerophosphoryl diester phosphodiesterase